MRPLFYFLCSLSIFTVSAKNEEYKGYKVYNVKFESQEQQEKLQDLKDDLIDFWQNPSFANNVVGRVMVPKSKLDWFEDKLYELGLPRDVYVEDVYQYLTKLENSSTKTVRNDANRAFGFDGYYRYQEILEYLDALQEAFTNSSIIITVEEYGTTEQNRPLVYLKVESNTNIDIDKPVIVVEAGINPREWITVPAALNIVNRLVENTTQFLDYSDWIIVPVLNPDGYEYTHTNLRLWSKSMSTKSDLTFICPGVNINRNFDSGWGDFDSSSSPCSHLYSGIEPLSEIETQMIQYLLQTYASRIRLYVSLQNNGGTISYPWQYERAASGMFRQHHLLGLDMAAAMIDSYDVKVGFEALGDRASGTSTDFVQQNGVLYPFTIHIVEGGDDGVNIPEERIADVIEDVWRAVEVAAQRLI